MKKLIKTALGFGVANIAVSKVANLNSNAVSQNIMSGMEIASLSIPISASKMVIKSTKKLW